MADVFTVCFSGTSCTRDEGEVSRPGSDKRIYSPDTGYIPVRIHLELAGSLTATDPSVTVRGCGENDWAVPRTTSEPLVLTGPLRAPGHMLDDLQKYSGGNQNSTGVAISGKDSAALALHGANLAARSGANAFIFIGHSRGAMECIMAAWFLQAYGSAEVQRIPVRIVAIDPVPGPGNWYGIITQLPPNVVDYVGVTAWDMLDTGFNGLVPRPNAAMAGTSQPLRLGSGWKNLADHYQLTDPLAAPQSGMRQPTNYQLFACRGRHATVAGNMTSNGEYDAADVDARAARVPELVYRLARAYLTRWGAEFRVASAVDTYSLALRQQINLDQAVFDDMAGGPLRDSPRSGNASVRQVSSISGRNPVNTYYLENVVGDPPYRQTYPVTAARTGAGWVDWTFL